MILRALNWLWNRFRPQEGWLAFFLLFTAAAFLVAAVIEVKWVPETAVIIPAAFWGLLLGTVLAKRSLAPFAAWFLITIYGLLLNTIWLGRLFPPLWHWFAGWQPFSQYIRQNSAVLFDQMASWFKAVYSGGSSQETIVFAMGLGIAAWFLTAYAAWSTFRRRQILSPLMVMGLALSVNSYYGQANLYWIILFVGLAMLLTAVFHLDNLEKTWVKNRMDYSDQIRIDLIMHASAIGLVVLALAMLLPSFSITKLAQSFQSHPAVLQIEETLGRVFAGVAQPRTRGQPGGPGGVGGSGVLPRSYLLGNPPELSETVVMTAVVTLPENVPPSLLNSHHWRALSYDVYTGRGWALSEERKEPLPANDLIPLLPAKSTVESQQTIDWIQDERIIRYTLGLPLRFDQEVTVIWRGLTDLARVQGTGPLYQVTTRLSAATGSQLRETAVADIQPTIFARYTTLPDSVPQRVHDLAQEVAGDLPTAFDQAQALERFLRQYPYSLDVELPPEDVDPVDFFLFVLQSGYCDYYATTMAVMARSLGLPARMAVGFLTQPPGANGVQTIYQINGHSWTEIYFPEYGWIEFEPTAAFPSPHDSLASTLDPASSDEAFKPPPEIPPPAPQEPVLRRLWRGWNRILLVVALVVGYWLWQRQQKQFAGRDNVIWAYGRLQHFALKLGQPPRPSQTPDEFTAVLIAHLNRYASNKRVAPLVTGLRAPIERLNRLFVRRRYGRETAVGTLAAQESWRQIRRPLWLLRLVNKVIR